MSKKYLDTKENSIESAVMQVWQEAAKLNEYQKINGQFKKVDGGDKRRTENKMKTEKKIDPVNPEAAKKKFDDRKDKDIDNDGDVDSSDKFLHKRRKAIGKAMKKEGLEDSPNPANSQHLCAKNVVHEDWGKGQTVHGMHAIPDADGNIAWYDVMFEHGIEKGIAINELKIKTSESHHNHDGKKKKNEGAMKRGKDMDTFKPKPKNEQAVPKSGFGLPTPKNVAKRVGMLGKAIKDRSDKAGKVPTSPVAKLSKEEVEFEKHREFKMQSMRDAVKKVWENENL